MTYKPPRKKKAFGLKGVAKVRLSGDKKKVQVIFREGGDEYVLSKRYCPDYVQPGEFYVSLSPDGKEMKSMSPLNDMVLAKHVKILAREGEEPAPRSVTKGEWTFQVFSVQSEIIEGKYKGMPLVMQLTYCFEDAEEEVNDKLATVVAIPESKSKYVQMTDDWCFAVGAWERGPMKYSDNILPTLDKRVRRQAEEGRRFRIVLKDGFPVAIYNEETSGEPEKNEEEFEESKPPKKSVEKDKFEPTEEPEEEQNSEDEFGEEKSEGKDPWDEVEEDKE